MTDWVDVAPIDELQPGDHKSIEIGYEQIIIFNIDGEFYALQDHCTHDGGVLSDGVIDGEQIMCSRHGARYCIKTGEVQGPPAFESIATFPLRIQNDIIQLNSEPVFV